MINNSGLSKKNTPNRRSLSRNLIDILSIELSVTYEDKRKLIMYEAGMTLIDLMDHLRRIFLISTHTQLKLTDITKKAEVTSEKFLKKTDPY